MVKHPNDPLAPNGGRGAASATPTPPSSAEALTAAQDPTYAPCTFASGEILTGRFKILRFIAQGGAGEVYEAEDQELRVPVALKVVRPEIAENEQAIERFRREIQLARQVTHRNVCRIYDVFRHEIPDSRPGRPPRKFLFLSMELLTGESLAARIHRRGPFTGEEAFPLVRDMVAGLTAAHRAGVIHRDFKSANVVLVPENGALRAVITDFGLARSEVETDGAFRPTITQSGTVVGTPTYMAPEQLTGGEITPAVDTYALGIVIYEMVTGTRPFKGETDLSTAVKRLTEAPASPKIHAPQIGSRWERAILRCLEREPGDRFRDLRELVQSLTETAEPPKPAATPARTSSSGTAAPPIPTPALPPKRRGRRVRLTVLSLVLALAVAGRFALSALPDNWLGSPPEAELVHNLDGDPTIAVLPFKNLSGASDDDWLSAALQEMVNMELAAGGHMVPLPSESVNRVTDELRLGTSTGLANDSIGKIRRLLDTRMVVDGSYLASSGQIRLHMRLHSEDSTVLLTVPGVEDQLFDLVSRAGTELRERLGIGEFLGRRQSLDEKPQAVALYDDGLREMRRLNVVSAMELFDRAIEEDPIHAHAHAELAGAWSYLGFERLAQRSFTRALDLAEPLSREQKLGIEGSYQLSLQEWEKAERLFGSLFRVFPDQRSFGLGLVRAQVGGGRGEAALATIEELRQAGTEDDYRIYLAEAEAAALTGDFELALQAARRQISAARKDAATLVAAEARLLEGRAFLGLDSLRSAQNSAAQARREFEKAGVQRGVADSLRLLATIREGRGDSDDATRLRVQAERIEGELRVASELI